MEVTPFGDAALLVAPVPSPHPLAAALRQAELNGVLGVVPGLDSLLVELDPLASDRQREAVEAALWQLAPLARAQPGSGRLREVPVVYDGPDLADVARLCGLSPEEVVALHAGTEVRVLLLGFSPGFAYLGELPGALAVPRLVTPRTRVPAGSVAIAGRQTAVYPSASPGGWRLIGRTDLTLFDPAADPPTFFAPGDRVRFVPA